MYVIRCCEKLLGLKTVVQEVQLYSRMLRYYGVWVVATKTMVSRVGGSEDKLLVFPQMIQCCSGCFGYIYYDEGSPTILCMSE